MQMSPVREEARLSEEHPLGMGTRAGIRRERDQEQDLYSLDLCKLAMINFSSGM